LAKSLRDQILDQNKIEGFSEIHQDGLNTMVDKIQKLKELNDISPNPQMTTNLHIMEESLSKIVDFLSTIKNTASQLGNEIGEIKINLDVEDLDFNKIINNANDKLKDKGITIPANIDKDSFLIAADDITNCLEKLQATAQGINNIHLDKDSFNNSISEMDNAIDKVQQTIASFAKQINLPQEAFLELFGTAAPILQNIMGLVDNVQGSLGKITISQIQDAMNAVEKLTTETSAASVATEHLFDAVTRRAENNFLNGILNDITKAHEGSFNLIKTVDDVRNSLISLGHEGSININPNINIGEQLQKIDELNEKINELSNNKEKIDVQQLVNLSTQRRNIRTELYQSVTENTQETTWNPNSNNLSKEEKEKIFKTNQEIMEQQGIYFNAVVETNQKIIEDLEKDAQQLRLVINNTTDNQTKIECEDELQKIQNEINNYVEKKSKYIKKQAEMVTNTIKAYSTNKDFLNQDFATFNNLDDVKRTTNRFSNGSKQMMNTASNISHLMQSNSTVGKQLKRDFKKNGIDIEQVQQNSKVAYGISKFTTINFNDIIKNLNKAINSNDKKGIEATLGEASSLFTTYKEIGKQMESTKAIANMKLDEKTATDEEKLLKKQAQNQLKQYNDISQALLMFKDNIMDNVNAMGGMNALTKEGQESIKEMSSASQEAVESLGEIADAEVSSKNGSTFKEIGNSLMGFVKSADKLATRLPMVGMAYSTAKELLLDPYKLYKQSDIGLSGMSPDEQMSRRNDYNNQTHRQDYSLMKLNNTYGKETSNDFMQYMNRDRALQLHNMSYGMIDFQDLQKNYATIAQQSGIRDTNEVAQMAEYTTMKSAVTNFSDSDITSLVDTFYQDLEMSGEETIKTIDRIANKVKAAGIPMGEYAKAVKSVADHYRSIGIDGAKAVDVMMNLGNAGYNVKDATDMSNQVGNAMNRFSDNPGQVMLAGILQGQSDPFQMLWDSQNTTNADGTANEQWAQKMSNGIDTNIEFTRSLFGNGALGDYRISRQLQDDYGFSKKQASRYINAQKEGRIEDINSLLKEVQEQGDTKDIQAEMLEQLKQLNSTMSTNDKMKAQIEENAFTQQNKAEEKNRMIGQFLENNLQYIDKKIDLTNSLLGTYLNSGVGQFMQNNPMAAETIDAVGTGKDTLLAGLGVAFVGGKAVKGIGKSIGKGVKGAKNWIKGGSKAADAAADVAGSTKWLKKFGTVGKVAAGVIGLGGVAYVGNEMYSSYKNSQQPDMSNQMMYNNSMMNNSMMMNNPMMNNSMTNNPMIYNNSMMNNQMVNTNNQNTNNQMSNTDSQIADINNQMSMANPYEQQTMMKQYNSQMGTNEYEQQVQTPITAQKTGQNLGINENLSLIGGAVGEFFIDKGINKVASKTFEKMGEKATTSIVQKTGSQLLGKSLGAVAGNAGVVTAGISDVVAGIGEYKDKEEAGLVAGDKGISTGKTALKATLSVGTAATGAAAGAAIGSAVPLIGTAIGAVLGMAGGALIDTFFEKSEKENNIARQYIHGNANDLLTQKYVTSGFDEQTASSMSKSLVEMNNNTSELGDKFQGLNNTQKEAFALYAAQQATQGKTTEEAFKEFISNESTTKEKTEEMLALMQADGINIANFPESEDASQHSAEQILENSKATIENDKQMWAELKSMKLEDSNSSIKNLVDTNSWTELAKESGNEVDKGTQEFFKQNGGFDNVYKMAYEENNQEAQQAFKNLRELVYNDSWFLDSDVENKIEEYDDKSKKGIIANGAAKSQEGFDKQITAVLKSENFAVGWEKDIAKQASSLGIDKATIEKLNNGAMTMSDIQNFAKDFKMDFSTGKLTYKNGIEVNNDQLNTNLTKLFNITRLRYQDGDIQFKSWKDDSWITERDLTENGVGLAFENYDFDDFLTYDGFLPILREVVGDQDDEALENVKNTSLDINNTVKQIETEGIPIKNIQNDPNKKYDEKKTKEQLEKEAKDKLVNSNKQLLEEYKSSQEYMEMLNSGIITQTRATELLTKAMNEMNKNGIDVNTVGGFSSVFNSKVEQEQENNKTDEQKQLNSLIDSSSTIGPKPVEYDADGNLKSVVNSQGITIKDIEDKFGNLDEKVSMIGNGDYKKVTNGYKYTAGDTGEFNLLGHKVGVSGDTLTYDILSGDADKEKLKSEEELMKEYKQTAEGKENLKSTTIGYKIMKFNEDGTKIDLGKPMYQDRNEAEQVAGYVQNDSDKGDNNSDINIEPQYGEITIKDQNKYEQWKKNKQNEIDKKNKEIEGQKQWHVKAIVGGEDEKVIMRYYNYATGKTYDDNNKSLVDLEKEIINNNISNLKLGSIINENTDTEKELSDSLTENTAAVNNNSNTVLDALKGGNSYYAMGQLSLTGIGMAGNSSYFNGSTTSTTNYSQMRERLGNKGGLAIPFNSMGMSIGFSNKLNGQSFKSNIENVKSVGNNQRYINNTNVTFRLNGTDQISKEIVKKVQDALKKEGYDLILEHEGE